MLKTSSDKSLADPQKSEFPSFSALNLYYGSSGKRVPAQFAGEERDCKNVIPAKHALEVFSRGAGIQEGWLGVAKQFFVLRLLFLRVFASSA